MFGALWSEHCGYKNSRPLLRRLPTEGPQVLQGPGENAGVVDVGDGWGVAFKMESHNHPSAVEPVQGAATGVGGILRDIFAMGARPFAVLDALRFGEIASPRTRYLLHGVVEGIAGYGNAIGVPTVGGEIAFHPSYAENPLVNVMALGLLRHEDLQSGTVGAVGHVLLYVGAKTGPRRARRRRLRLGRPQRRLGRRSTGRAGGRPLPGEAAAGGLPRGDPGRPGGRRAGHGRRRPHLERGRDGPPGRARRRPRRRPRAAPRARHDAARGHAVRVAGADGADRGARSRGRADRAAAALGARRGPGRGRARPRPLPGLRGRAAGRRHAGGPAERRAHLRARGRRGPGRDGRPRRPLDDVPPPADAGAGAAGAAGRPDDRQQARRVRALRPPGDDEHRGAARRRRRRRLRVKGSDRAVAATVDCNARYVGLAPRLGAALAVVEAARNLAAVGATPLGVTDNLNFGNPTSPRSTSRCRRRWRACARPAWRCARR
jgi:hypothetical protein